MTQKTPLYDEAVRLGAKFTEFAGWELPLYYSSIIEEHMAVRSAAGLFDISHLGKLFIRGTGAAQTLDDLATARISKLSVGKGTYTLFCNEEGGVLDDEILYRTAAEEYLLLTNAAQVDVLHGLLNEHKTADCTVDDMTRRLCLLALQGPESPGLLKTVFNEEPGAYSRYTIREVEFEGGRLMVMKSGYTGEEGYELMGEPGVARSVWRSLIDRGVKPSGLGARDTLRLEMGYMLYGKDLTDETTPLEAGLKWAVAFDKESFVGKQALQAQLERGIDRRLAGIVLERGIARGGERVLLDNGEEIGKVTSGGYSPVLKKGICMANIRRDLVDEGRTVYVEVREKRLKGYIKRPPFISR